MPLVIQEVFYQTGASTSGKIIVKSDNPGYSPFEVSGPDLDNIKVLGRVYVVMNIHKP